MHIACAILRDTYYINCELTLLINKPNKQNKYLIQQNYIVNIAHYTEKYLVYNIYTNLLILIL